MKDAVRPDYITYYDPSVEYYIADPIQYLPERERLELKAKREKEQKSNTVTDQSSLLTDNDDGRDFSINEIAEVLDLNV